MKKFTNRIALLLILIWYLPQSILAAELLIPVGQVVGLELDQSCVTVAAFDETLGKNARDAGLQVGDRIVAIDGTAVQTAEDVQTVLDRAGSTLTLQVLRDGKTLSFQMKPHTATGRPRLGVYLRQGITGIGTVTWYDPESGSFGTLGHGVSTASGALAEMTGGCAYPARVLSVKKGKAGSPGQLVGTLASADPLGSLSGNTRCGVFGVCQRGWKGEALPVGQAEQIRTGEATILSTVDETGPREYSVEILKIYAASRDDGRNLLLRVTDPALLEITGGIVQGMSGSPIIQDGKLVGAVTHVLVNDPTTGYGIFIDNMLDAAA